MASVRQAAIWELVKERQECGGAAWDREVLAQSQSQHMVKRKLRNRPPKPRNSGDVLGGISSEERRLTREEIVTRLMDETNSSTAPDSEPLPFSVMSNQHQKPVGPVRTRQKTLPSYTARFFPSYVPPVAETFQVDENLAQKCGFSAEKVKSLYGDFLKFAKPSKSHDREMRLSQRGFLRLMEAHGVVATPLVVRVFGVYLHHGEADIKFARFLKLLGTFKNDTRRLQAKAIFKLCDLNCDRKLNSLELLRLVTDGVPKSKRMLINAILDELLTLLNAATTEEIGYHDFIDAVEGNDAVWELFKALSPFTRMHKIASGETKDYE